MSRAVLAAVVTAMLSSLASAQDAYPVKSIRIVSPASGGGSDFVARLLAPKMSESLGQQVIVDNRGAISAEIVAKAAPDGYTLHVNGPPLWVMPLMRTTAWDAQRDFVPVSLAVISPSILAVHPSLPVNTVRDVIAIAKARPGQLNYAAGTIGAAPHLAGELFKSMAGVNIEEIPYKSSAQALTDVMSGEVLLNYPSLAAVLPHIKSGRVKGLAVSGAKRSQAIPEIPAMAEFLPGYEASGWYGIIVPSSAPAQLVARLNGDIVRVLGVEDTKQKMASQGAEVVGSSPDEFAKYMREGREKWDRLIRQLNIPIQG